MESNHTIKGYAIVNLDDMIMELGEDMVKHILLSFYCPLSKDVEIFLHTKAIEFSKHSIAKTHLIFCSYKSKMELIAYFSLANKSIHLGPEALSKNLRKKIVKFGRYNSSIKKYIVTAPLIGQLGKNFNFKEQKLITGDELLKIACDKIQEMQSIVGGRIVYLECEDKPFLKQFYSENVFVEFGKRKLDRDETDISGEYLIQMLKYLHKT